MRAHEVPTHVQAEDKVLLWFTFPQIVGLIAICAISYGAYRILPFGPSEVRMALAIVFGLVGVAVTVGKVGGRSLPLAVADLLRYGLGPRRYAGTPAQLVRSEPPSPIETTPGPLSLMAKRARRGLSRQRKSKNKDRRNGRMPFRPHGWFGKRRSKKEEPKGADTHKTTYLKTKPGRVRRTALALTALLVLASAIPQAAMADGHEPWRDEIGFDYQEPIPGRRLYVEGLRVSDDSAQVTLRAATDLGLRTRAYGGWQGRQLRFFGTASLDEGEAVIYSLPLSGESPSFTFSWEDSLGQAGAVTLKDEQIPYPLPSVDGEVCDLRVSSLGWKPGTIEGVIASDCVSHTQEVVEVTTATGHHSDAVTALRSATVTGITGSINVGAGGSNVSVSFVPNGQTTFSLPVGEGQAIHSLGIRASLSATVQVTPPAVVQLTHHPERTEERTETVSLWRPGTSQTVSETVTVTHDDGTTTEHTISADLSIPGKTVYKNVTLTIVHPEYVEAEVVQPPSFTLNRSEANSLAVSIGSDAPFQVLELPEPEPEPEPAEQTLLTDEEARSLFDRLGWLWPW